MKRMKRKTDEHIIITAFVFWKPKGQKNTNPPLFGKLGLEGMIK